MTASLDPSRSEWDVIVIGGAPPGENAAQYATQTSGLEAVIVEEALVGGECSYWACMPSKGLLRPVEVLDIGRHLPGVKGLLGDSPLDVDAVLARRDKIVNQLDDTSQVKWCVDTGIDVIRGHGRLDGEKTVVVTKPDGTSRTITARHAVVIDTGSSAAVPDIPGLRAARPWISRDVTNIHTIPRRMVIIGGGVVACEAATWLMGLGVEELTIVQGGPALLAKNEPFAGELVADQLRDSGVALALGARLASVSRPVVHEVNDAGVGVPHGGEVTVTLDNGQVIVADEIVVAAGRDPNSTTIGLSTVGLSDGGYLSVDDHMTVEGVPGEWLYAIGDVCGRALLTHMGKYQARIAGEVIATRAAGQPLDASPYSRHADVADHDRVPQVTFTEPEVGSVGLTEKGRPRQGNRRRDRRVRSRVAGGDLPAARGLRGASEARHRPGDRHAHRCDVRRICRLRPGPSGHDRHCGKGAASRALARGTELPDTQRDLAAAAGNAGYPAQRQLSRDGSR